MRTQVPKKEYESISKTQVLSVIKQYQDLISLKHQKDKSNETNRSTHRGTPRNQTRIPDYHSDHPHNKHQHRSRYLK